MRAIGVDLGFGYTKASDGINSTIFTSLIGEASPRQFGGGLELKGVDGGPPGSESGEHIQLELPSGEYFFGELAERESNVRSFTLDQERFIEEAALPFTLAAVSTLGYLDHSINLVAGLPIANFNDRSSALEEHLRGRHELAVVAADGNRYSGTIEILDVRTIPEPFGAVYDLVLDSRGQLANKPLAEEKIGIIDIGFHTVDFTVADRTSFLGRASASTEAGIARAFTVIAAKLREKSDVQLPVYRLFDAVSAGRMRVRGSVYDLTKLTEHVFGQLAEEIAAQANDLWADEWDIDRVIITGGGGALLAPYVSSLIQGRVETIEGDADPRLSNVEGFVKYAAHLWGPSDDPPPRAPVRSAEGTETATH